MRPLAFRRPASVLLLLGTSLGPAVAQAATSVWVMDTEPFRLVRLATDGTVLWERPVASADGLDVDPRDGSAWTPEPYTSDGLSSLAKLSPDGTVPRRIGDPGKTFGGAVAVDPNDGSVWTGVFVSPPATRAVMKLDASGCEILRRSGFDAPASMAVDARDGSLWIADGGGPAGRHIVKLDRLGNELFRAAVAGGFFSNATQQVAIDPRDGSIWYVQGFRGAVVKRSSTGALLVTVPGFDFPVAVGVDPTDGSVWVANLSLTTPGAVVKLDHNGHEIVRTVLASSPLTVRVDPADRRAWVGIEGAVVVLSAAGQVEATLGGFATPRAIVVASPPDAAVTAAEVSRFSGAATGVGAGEEAAGTRVLGRFSAPSDVDLGAATLRIVSVLGEPACDGGVAELVRGLPLVLSPIAGSHPDLALFEKRTSPSFTFATIKGLRGGEFTFSIKVTDSTIDRPPLCSPSLRTTRFEIDDGDHPPIVVSTEQRWICFGLGNAYLKTLAP